MFNLKSFSSKFKTLLSYIAFIDLYETKIKSEFEFPYSCDKYLKNKMFTIQICVLITWEIYNFFLKFLSIYL